MAEHETDYQRARRQRSEVKQYGITGSTPQDAAKRIKEHTANKKKVIAEKMSRADKVGSRKMDFTSMQKQGNWMKVHKLDWTS